ncbi:MAG: PmoA family protein [Fimbriimonadaceae bacterium]|nr:PmoA family protein [Fimbriimonadaceae bacterium]
MSDLKLTVSAGIRDRSLCPVKAILDGPGVAVLRLGEVSVPCQSIPLPDNHCEVRFIVDRLAAGQTREYVATLGEPATGGNLAIQDDGAAVSLLQSGALLGTYHVADPNAARPYWYPLFDPHGGRCTRGFPMDPQPGERADHKHHKSMWVAYGDVNGTDNWSEEPGHATQQHERWQALLAGPVYALLDHELTWLDPAGDPVLLERRQWRVYDLPASSRIWDLEIILIAAPGAGDVRFGDTKEGGLLSLRVTSSMDAPKGRIENAIGGINEDETWGKRAQWCDYSGPVNGNWVGIAAFDHPSSFRYPTWWHVRNYGLMTANCFGWSHFTNGASDGTYVLPAGELLHFAYRVYFHAGDAQQGQVATKYHDYIHPPVVKVG